MSYESAVRGLAGIFDEDEEDLPVGFQQDEDEDEIGVGTWKYKDGSTKYSKGDPQLAKTLMKAGPPAPEGDRRTLEMPNTKPLSEEEKSRLAPPAEEVQKLSDQLDGSPRKPQPEASEQPKPLAPLRAPGLPGASGPARYSDSAQAQRSASANQSESSSESTTRSAMSQEDFDQQQGQTQAGYDQAIGRTDAGTAGQVSAIRQRAEQLAQLGRDKEAATAGAMAQRDERANYVKAKIQEVGSRKTDMNGLWKEKGALGTTLGLLGVALRSITATKFGGPNTAMQSLQEQRKQNLQAQMEDRDSELRGLERELGSLDAAVPMLEARMRDAEAKRLEAMMADEKSQEVIANGNRLVSQLQIERDQKLAESAKAFYGTVAKQQATSAGSTVSTGETLGRERVSGAGVSDGPAGKTQAQVYDELLDRDKKMEERGVPKEERAKMWTAHGFDAPSGESAPARTDREQREKIARDEAAFTEAEGKAESAFASFGQYGEAFGLTRDPKTGKLVAPDGIRGLQSPAYQEKIPGAIGFATPIEDARTAALEGLGRLQSGGAITADEEKRFTEILGDDDITRDQLASKLNALETLINTRRKANRREAPKGIPGSWKSKSAEGAQ